jgi:pentatricopeptide repeat protein
MSHRTIEVWNEINFSSRKPTITTWHAMIDGCRKARDPAAIEEVWQRMIASGTKPDIGCWTTRIDGLMSAGKWKLGLKIFHEMGQAWLKASQSSKVADALEQPTAMMNEGNRTGNNTSSNMSSKVSKSKPSSNTTSYPVKPNITLFNAVISKLVRLRKTDLVAQTLAWGDKFDIQSDIVTFNTLLRSNIRDGDFEDSLALMQIMQEHGIKPDVVTFTIVIDGLFRQQVSRPEKDQATFLSNLLSDMEASGIPANAYTYGTIINGLLKYHSNVDAVSAVLTHMSSRNVKLSPHIYTILLTHYFNQEPADLMGIETLWNRIRLSGDIVDAVFYDQMVEGYAKLGRIDKMTTFLKRMSEQRKQPSWGTLATVVKTLANSGEWLGAQEIIKDFRIGRSISEDRPMGRPEEKFWKIVKELELVDNQPSTSEP